METFHLERIELRPKMELLRTNAILLAVIIIISAEWVEIAQKETQPNRSKPKVGFKITKRIDANVLFKPESTTTPSPMWIEYQRERFSNKQNANSQRLIVSAEQRLKNSAKVLVPASKRLSANSRSTPRNTIFKAKSRIDVVNDDKQANRHMPNDDEEEEEAFVDDHKDHIEYNEEKFTADDEESLNFESEQNKLDNRLQFPSVQGFLRFLKSIQRNWIKKSAFSVEQKIELLKQLKDNLMRTIEQQFIALWQPREHRRRKRGLLDESTLNFPPEAALMSINFLTFAVFLIKLVLQVVNVIKSKHYSFTGFGINGETYSKTSQRL